MGEKKGNGETESNLSSDLMGINGINWQMWSPRDPQAQTFWHQNL